MSSSIRPTRRQVLAGIGALGALGASRLVAGCSKSDDAATPVEHHDAIVVGSGFGGSIAALRLGRAGVETLVLERGRRWPITDAQDTFCASLKPDGRSTWLREETILPIGPAFPIDSDTGVLERVDFDGMKIYAGAAVGGGSIVYGGMTVQPREDHFGLVFPAEVSWKELDATYYPRVREMLTPSRVPDDLYQSEYWLFSRICEAQAKKAGLSVQMVEQTYDWDVIRQELAGTKKPSALMGELIYGNNSGCKKSLDRNYLPAAEATGRVKIAPLSRVKAIGQDASGVYTLDVESLDSSGSVLAVRKLSCRLLFLAAGTVGTSRLLVRARATGALPKLNAEVGQGFGSNGNGMFRRVGLTDATGDKQGAPPLLAIVDFANAISPVLAECAQFPLGSETHSLLHLGLAIDPSRGQFVYDAATDDVRLEWPADGNAKAKAAIEDLAARMNAANGGKLDDMWPVGVTNDFTYHPLGGMVMGKACDFFGRVNGYRGLYVVDGSLVPGSAACANPSFTIAAIAERAMEHIVSEDVKAG